MNIQLWTKAVKNIHTDIVTTRGQKCYDKDNKEIVINTEAVNAKIEELEVEALINSKLQAIENNIYSFYPQKKQAQDEKYVSSYTTKLKALGVVDLEVKVVSMITSFFSGKSLNEVLVNVSENEKPFFEKLVKIGVRTEWAELCVIEGKTAIAENREPTYVEFPKFYNEKR